jgi:hypothetical protein
MQLPVTTVRQLRKRAAKIEVAQWKVADRALRKGLK